MIQWNIQISFDIISLVGGLYMIKNNYHTHVSYCNHAIGEVEDYVKKAISLGFDEIGITDHAPIPENFMNKTDYEHNWCSENMKVETIDKYLNDIKECQNKYSDKIKILSGFESEFLPKELEFYKFLRSKVDYLNLGIHYFEYNNKIYNTYSDVDEYSLDGYVKTCILAMESGLFNTLVHPDLFMYNYPKFDDKCILATKAIITSAIKNNVYLEINAGGVRHSRKNKVFDRFLYPNIDFWKICKNYPELKIIIGADSHKPSELGSDEIQEVCRFAEELGLNVLQRMEILH